MGYTPVAARTPGSAAPTGSAYTPVASRTTPAPLSSTNTAPVDFNALNIAPTMADKSIADYSPSAKPDLSQKPQLYDDFGMPQTDEAHAIEQQPPQFSAYKPVAQRPTFSNTPGAPLGTPVFRQNPIADNEEEAAKTVGAGFDILNYASGTIGYALSGHNPLKYDPKADYPRGISEQAQLLASDIYGKQMHLPKAAVSGAGTMIGLMGDPLNLVGEGEAAGLLKTLRGAKDVEEVGNALREAGLASDIADQYKEIVFNARKDKGALTDALSGAEKLHNTTKLSSAYTPVAARAGEEAHAIEKGAQAGKEIAGDNSPKTSTALDAIQTKPEVFQFSRRFEPMAQGGFVPEKVAGISKDFSAERLAKNPIDVGTFDKPVDYKLPSGKAVHLEADTPYVISGHNRLEILKRNAADAGSDLGKYVRTTRYAGTQEGVGKAIRDSIMSNVKNKSIKDIELLDNAINGNIDKKAVQEALDFDTKKAKYFNTIADTFRQNGMVDFWNGSVAPKLAALKGLDFGVLQERLNFVERVARKAGEVVTGMTPSQAEAMKHELAAKIGDLLSNGKKATLASVEKQITQRLDTIRSGGFKNVQGKSLFGDIVTTSSVQARVPVQAMDAAIAASLKNGLVPKAMRKRLGEVGRLLEKRDPWITDYINTHGGMTQNGAKTKALLEKLATLSQEDLVKTVATPEMKANALKLEAQFTAHQAQFKQAIEDVAKDTGLSIKVGPAKKAPRILEKLVMDYRGDIGKIMDGNRATILVDNPADVAKAVAAVQQKIGPFARDMLSTFDKAPGGYERYRMNLSTEAGHVAEVQITTPEMWKAKTEEGGQTLYNQVRLKEGDWEAADRKMQKLYANARTHFAARAATNASASAEEISWPSARALSGGKPQPVSMISPKISPSESLSTRTGVPSTSKNLGNEASAIPHNITTTDGSAQEARAANKGISGDSVTGPKVPLLSTKKVSVGEGMQAPRAEPKGPVKIDDRVPLPPTVGELLSNRPTGDLGHASQPRPQETTPHAQREEGSRTFARTSSQGTTQTVDLSVKGSTVGEKVRSVIGRSQSVKTQIVNKGQEAYLAGRGLTNDDFATIRDGYQAGKPIAEIAADTSKPDQASAFMKKMAGYYDYELAADRAAGGETPKVQHYLPQYWDLSNPVDKARWDELAKQRGIKPYYGFRSQAKVFKSYAEGIAAGFTPARTNILEDLKANYGAASNAISTQALKSGLQKAAPDLVSSVGRGLTTEGKPFVNSNIPGLEGMSYHPSIDKMLQGFQPLKHPDFIDLVKKSGAEAALEHVGVMRQIDKMVAMAKSAPANAKEAGIGGVLGSIYDHVTSPMKQVLWNWSGFHSVNITLSHMGASTLHPVTGAKGVVQSVGAAVSERLYQATVHSYKTLMVAKDAAGKPQSVFDWAVESGALEERGLPALGIEHFHPFAGGHRVIFDREIPVLQMNLAEQAARKGIVATSPQGIALGKEIRAITGEINAKTMNINPNTLKAASRAFLAPGFTFSKYKTLLDSFTAWGAEHGAAGNLARQAVIGKSAIVGVAATLGTLLATGKFPNLQQLLMNFSFNPSVQTNFTNPKGNKLDVTFPKTFLAEGASAVLNPVAYGNARLNPLISDMLKLYTNQDYYGRPLIDPNVNTSTAMQLAQNLGIGHLPIGAQAIINTLMKKQTALQGAIQVGGLGTHVSPSDPVMVKYAGIDHAKALISAIAPDDPNRLAKMQTIFNSLPAADRKSLAYQEMLAGVKTKGIYQSDVEQKYFQAQELLKQGDIAGATAITKGMSKQDYQTYRSIKTRLAHEATFQQVKDLVAKGDMQGASALTGAMTKQVYQSYQTWKKNNP